MFKIPNWEDDVPKSKVDFGKTSKRKKEKKVIEAVQSPDKSSNSQSLTKVAKINKQKKKNKKSLGNTNTVTRTSENSLSKVNNKSNNNVVKPNKKQRQNQRNTQDSVQQKQFSNKKSGNYVQNHLNGNTNRVSQVQEGHPLSSSKDKPKKKRSKKRKFKSQETTSAIDTQAEENTEDNIDISEPSKPKKKKFSDDLDPSNNTLLPSKKKKKGIQSEDPKIIQHLSKVDRKKEKLRKILQIESNRNSINVNGNKLRERMLERLKAAQFRFLNEKLYTTSGSEAQQLFQSDPEAFQTYHQGYQQQLKKWPVNPSDLIVKRVSKMPKTHTIADMGCGEAKLSKRVQQTVRSFDLVASVPGVEACDMAHTPLLSASVDAAVYCLALMGTDLTQYLVEANRVLKMGGHLLIAEVESRFDKVENFTDGVQKLGFKLKNLDKSHQVFYFMEFTKVRDPPAKKSKLPALTLKPCLYKKR